MGSPVNPKYPLFLRDINKGGSGFSTIVVEDNFNIDAKPGVFYDIKNKENDEININLEDNNNNQFLINCPCTLSFNKDINWIELDEPNLIVPIQMLITVVNNIANYKPIVDDSGDNNKVIIYKFNNKPNNINRINNDYRVDSDFQCYKNYNNFGIIIDFDSIYNEDETQVLDSYIINISEPINRICDMEDNDIVEVIFPNHISALYDYSINNLKNLHKINIPKECKLINFSNIDIDILYNIVYHYYNLQYIDNWLIANLYDVNSIIIKEGTVGIATNFMENVNIILDELKFPNSLKYINDNVFSLNVNSTNLPEIITFNEGLISIGDNCFKASHKQKYVIPSTLEHLGHNSLGFIDESMFIDGLNYFGKVLYNCYNKQYDDIIVKEGTTQIYDSCFHTYGNEMKTITLPNSLKEISVNAFQTCHNLTHITIPDSVEYIASNAFLYCESLKTITTAKGTYHVGEYSVYIELANGKFVTLYLDEEYYECVLPETEILINNQGDTKQIKDLQIGDTVITNKNNNLIETTINKLVQVQHNNYLKVTLENNDVLNISLDHNICTKDGWKCYNNVTTKNKECVGKLTIGDEVLTTNGFIKIVSIEMINKENTIMYNIGVKEGNNYYANGICIYECDK